MLMTLNQDELGAIRSYASRLGVPFRFDPQLNGDLQGTGAPFALRLPPAEAVLYDLNDPERLAAWNETCTHYAGYEPSSTDLYTCNAGKYSFHIDPYGKMSLCVLSRTHSYDLRQGTS